MDAYQAYMITYTTTS